MTVASTTPSITYVGNGSTTTFTVPYEVPYQTDGVTPALLVRTVTSGVVATKVLGTDYTVSGEPSETQVVFSVAPAAGVVVRIDRSLVYSQGDTYSNQGTLPSTIEEGLDALAMQLQQIVVNQNFVAGPYTVATLPANPFPGQKAYVTDALAPAWNQTVTGGGTVNAEVRWNGANWVAC